MIALGIFFFALAYQNETEEKKKFEEYKASMVKNPLSNIWIWVSLNIVGQLMSEVESILIYNYYGGQECYPIQVPPSHSEQHRN